MTDIDNGGWHWTQTGERHNLIAPDGVCVYSGLEPFDREAILQRCQIVYIPNQRTDIAQKEQPMTDFDTLKGDALNRAVAEALGELPGTDYAHDLNAALTLPMRWYQIRRDELGATVIYGEPLESQEFARFQTVYAEDVTPAAIATAVCRAWLKYRAAQERTEPLFE